MQMMEALIRLNKQFDSQIYQIKINGIYGGMTRIQLQVKNDNKFLRTYKIIHYYSHGVFAMVFSCISN
jgi:hypothetical protein